MEGYILVEFGDLGYSGGGTEADFEIEPDPAGGVQKSVQKGGRGVQKKGYSRISGRGTEKWQNRGTEERGTEGF